MNWEARLEAALVLRKAALAKRRLERNAVEPSEERPVTADIFQNTGLELRVDSDTGTEEEQSECPRALKALSGAERLDEALARRSTLDQIIYLLDCAVEDRNAVPAALDVQRQILAHHRQADQAEIAKFAHC